MRYDGSAEEEISKEKMVWWYCDKCQKRETVYTKLQEKKMIVYFIVGFTLALTVYTIVSLWYWTIKTYKEIEGKDKDEDEF